MAHTKQGVCAVTSFYYPRSAPSLAYGSLISSPHSFHPTSVPPRCMADSTEGQKALHCERRECRRAVVKCTGARVNEE